MGTGSSGLSKSSGGGSKANTPSGVSYDQFMKMSDIMKYRTMQDIINNPNIKTPDTLDDSITSKVIYGLGMVNKPKVVTERQLDRTPGTEIYRTVYESGTMPPPSSSGILDQIRNGDYTHMSGSGGSAHGRALYFATDFRDSASYGDYNRNAKVMRSKISPKANIVSEKSLRNQMQSDSRFQWYNFRRRDDIALYALSHGIDGWESNTYRMIVNRGVLTASTKNKKITKKGARSTSENVDDFDVAYSWAEAGSAR